MKKSPVEKLMGAVDRMVGAARQAESARDEIIQDAKRKQENKEMTFGIKTASEILDLTKHAIKDLAEHLNITGEPYNFVELLGIILLNDCLKMGWPATNSIIVMEFVASLPEDEARRAIVAVDLNDDTARTVDCSQPVNRLLSQVLAR